jgi:alpha-L-rhamnosidase
MKMIPLAMRILAMAARPALASAIALVAPDAPGQPSAPVRLLVNGVSQPLAIDRDTTRFTWQSADTRRGERQTAYQILVASSPGRLAPGNADWWDSGKVDSDGSSAVEYAGKALPAATRIWWTVRIWDQTGQPGRYNAPAIFDTGLNQNEWTAHYLWDGTTNPNHFAYFRKSFSVSHQPALAKVYVTAHNDYMLYFNGHPLGRGPARCDPYHNGQYNAYDITGLVTTGTNVFAAIGHWHGLFNDSGVNAKPAFLLEARFSYPDGSTATVGTDNSWKVPAQTPFIETNATYFGSIVGPRNSPPPKDRVSPPYAWSVPDSGAPGFAETDWGNGGASNRAAIQFDARLEPAGWQEENFDDSQWAPATVVDRSNYHLFAQTAPLENEQAELKPASVVRTNGTWLVDFGRCLDGWPKLTMHANHPGDVVRVEYFEESGAQMPAGWDQYTCRGGTETWDAGFGRHTTFQEFRITGYAGALRASDVRAMWAYCDADVAGRFHCSNALLNDIYEMCERSARQNIQQGMISVDAQREQSQWTADSWNIGNVLLYNHRNTMMIDKVVRDFGMAQLPDGDFPSSCPAQRSSRIPEWSMYWPMLLWQQYLFSGDKTLLREMAPRLARFLDWVKSSQDPKTKLLNPPRWRISDYPTGTMPSGGYNTATACQFYENLRVASRVFSILGQADQSREYLRQADELKAGINSLLFNAKFYRARTDREEMFPLASAWALRFDLEPEADRAGILETILAARHPIVGGYGCDAFYSGLLNAGGGEYVVRDLVRYRPMLDSNKANWENFALRRSEDEVNHAWTSYPAYLFLKYICGIQPTSGGFATFDVRPETGGLTFAEGTVPAVKGLITTRWEKDGQGGFTLKVRVPANTQASIYLPTLSRGDLTVTESGKTLWPVPPRITDPGIVAITREGRFIRCFVGGGEYRFSEQAQARDK